MSVTIPTKDLGDVQDKRGGDFKKGIEERNENYIKKELRI
jgi:hypothetical protein